MTIGNLAYSAYAVHQLPNFPPCKFGRAGMSNADALHLPRTPGRIFVKAPQFGTKSSPVRMHPGMICYTTRIQHIARVFMTQRSVHSATLFSASPGRDPWLLLTRFFALAHKRKRHGGTSRASHHASFTAGRESAVFLGVFKPTRFVFRHWLAALAAAGTPKGYMNIRSMSPFNYL